MLLLLLPSEPPPPTTIMQAQLPLEVLHVMNWHLDHAFVLSASLHGGALVASYPMDACDQQGSKAGCPSEDDPLPLRLARATADAHGRMARMEPAHRSFDRGVARGSEWAPLVGTMQVSRASLEASTVGAAVLNLCWQ